MYISIHSKKHTYTEVKDEMIEIKIIKNQVKVLLKGNYRFKGMFIIL